jgi:hypothetical protein
MNIIQSEGLSYNGTLTEELVKAVEIAKNITKNYTIASDGRRTCECDLELIIGNNLYNSQIILTTKKLGEQLGYYSGGKFFASFGYRGQEIKFVR